MKRTVSARKSSKSSSSSRGVRSADPDRREKYAICLHNDGYRASLELRKLYRILPDGQAARHKMIRVVDESGDDYLYPVSWFKTVPLSPAIHRALAAVAV